jgi:hypothetical protein
LSTKEPGRGFLFVELPWREAFLLGLLEAEVMLKLKRG